MKEMKEIKNKPSGSGRKAGYASPATRVIGVRMRKSILGASDPITETEDGGDI